MYAKLALNNAKRSIKDYLIYFVTLTICVSLFYGFMSLSSSSYELITGDSYNFEILKEIIKYATYMITALMILLIGYVNKYMLKRRQREFATYMLLGIPQKNVAFMFFIETLIMGIISIILGVFIGTLFSQFLTALILMTANQKIVFSFRLYLDALSITFMFFMFMFCIIGALNIRILNRTKLINMFNSEKKTEFQFRKSKKVYIAIFVVAVLLYLICGFCSYKLLKVYNDPSLRQGNEGVYIELGLISFIMGTYALFYSLSYVFIAINDRWKNFKYEYTNLFLIGSIVSKIKTTPILMATISLTFLGAALSFTLTLLGAKWALGFLDNRIPFDIVISNEYNTIKEIKDIPKVDYSDITEYLRNQDYGVKGYCQVEKYFLNDSDFNKRGIKEMPKLGISLSDFNKMREILGYKQVELKKDEFTTQWNETSDDYISDYITKNSTIDVKGNKLNISSNPYYKESIGEYIYNLNTEEIIILPDEICKGLTIASTDLYINTSKKISYEKAMELEEDYIPSFFENKYSVLFKREQNYKPVSIRLKVSATNEVLNGTLAMRILGVYGGTILLMIGLTILALQQLLDSIENKDRFNILRKLGIDNGGINKIILKQISIYFILPISIGIVGFVVFMINFQLVNSKLIALYVGGKDFIFNVAISLLLIIVIYLCYFLSTYYSFKRNIKGK